MYKTSFNKDFDTAVIRISEKYIEIYMYITSYLVHVCILHKTVDTQFGPFHVDMLHLLSPSRSLDTCDIGYFYPHNLTALMN